MKQPNFFKYLGGKYRLAKKLIPLFPEHVCFVDVFGGAGNITLQKPPSKIEVFNDINSDIHNLFKVLRDNLDEFNRLVWHSPYSRETFNEYLNDLETETNKTKRAAMWYCVAYMSFGGMHGGSWGFSKLRDGARAAKNKIDRLPEIADRLREVQIENRDFSFILDTYDGKDTFFYLDPPYVPETRRSVGEYANEMTLQDHERLIDMLRNVKGKVMLSGYANTLYDTLGWQKKTFDSVVHAAAKTRSTGLQGSKIKMTQKRTEVVWMNYEAI